MLRAYPQPGPLRNVLRTIDSGSGHHQWQRDKGGETLRGGFGSRLLSHAQRAERSEVDDDAALLDAALPGAQDVAVDDQRAAEEGAVRQITVRRVQQAGSRTTALCLCIL